jgi:hypothetical protein
MNYLAVELTGYQIEVSFFFAKQSFGELTPLRFEFWWTKKKA